MAKVKDTSFLGEKLETGSLVVVAAKSGKSDFCWAVVTRFMGSSMMVIELDTKVARRVNDVLVLHVEDIKTTLTEDQQKEYKRIQEEEL